MVNNKSKKGFTLIELIIVIAILGVLAAILVPIAVNELKTAKIGADTAVAKQMNSALSRHEALNGKNKTMSDALDVILKAGFALDKLTPTAEGGVMCWDQQADRIAFFNDANELVYSEGYEVGHELWSVAHNQSEFDELTQNYSLFLAENYPQTTINPLRGLDVGNNTNITDINYVQGGRTEPQNVILCTNGGTLTINAPLDTVTHYGESIHVNIIAIAGASYHENGKISGTLTVESGNVEIEMSAEVGGIVVSQKSESNTAIELPKVNAKSGSKTGIIVINTIETEIKVETGAEVIAVAPGNDTVKVGLQESSSAIMSGVSETIINTDDVIDTSKSAEFEGGFGSEVNPFIIKSIEYFNKFRNLENGFATGGYYWNVSSNLDLKDITLADEDNCYVEEFNGVIDFMGNEVRVQRSIQTNLFKTLSNATIKNLKFVISGQVGLVRVIERGDVLIENVNTFGSFSTSDNNLVPFVRGVNPYPDSSLTFSNCSNNAICTSTTSNGCSGLFVGTGWNYNNGFVNEDSLKEFRLTFNSCVNNGSLFASASSAAMLISNISLFGNGMKPTNVTINDCVNNGTIYGNRFQTNLAVGRNGGFGVTVAIYNDLNSATNIRNGVTGVCANNANAFGTITISDNKFNLQQVANATHYNLAFNFWNFDFSDKELTQQTGWGQEGKTIVLTSLDGIVVPSYSWRADYEGKALSEVHIGDTILYSFTDGDNTYMAYKGIADDTYYHKLRESGINNTVTLTAFDSEGKVLSISTYSYSD